MTRRTENGYEIGAQATQFGGGPGGPTGSDAADAARRMRAISPDSRFLPSDVLPGTGIAP